MEISVISPVYGAPTLLHELVRQIEETVSKLTPDYEIILVEDHSPDNSREIITEICQKNKRVKGVFLSRNFGQQYALNAGFDLSTGNYVVTLDCDLQNPPAQIKDLYVKIQEGYDIVFASRQNRPDNFFMTQGSHLFNKLMGFLTDTRQDESLAEFAIYRRKVVDAMAQMGDYRRYYPLMNQWVGFKTAKVLVNHDERTDGKESSYSMRKRIDLAVTTAVSFSTKSLRLIVYFGVVITFLAILLALFLVIKTLVMGIDVSGWVTLFVSMWFIAGILVTVIGVVAVYVGNIFDEVKHRPTEFRMNKKIFSNKYFWWGLGLIIVLIATSVEVFRGRNTNYFDYQDSTRMFWEGLSPYNLEYAQAHQIYFLYSPVFSVIFAPIFYLPWWLGPYVWNIGNYTLFSLAIKWLPQQLEKYKLYIFVFLLSVVMQTVFCYQHNIIVSYIYIFAFILLERGKGFWAVFLIMLSATTKIYGVAELAILLCYPKVWRNFGYAILCGAFFLLLPAVNTNFDNVFVLYQQMFDMIADHHSATDFVGILFAIGLKPFLLPNYRLVQVMVFATLAVLFFWRYKRWNNFRFRVQALGVLSGFMILFSEAAAQAQLDRLDTVLVAGSQFLHPPHRRTLSCLAA